MTAKIVILGAGGHGQVVADILTAARRAGAPEVPIGFLDDDESLTGTTILGLPVLAAIARLSEFKHDGAIIAIGDNPVRQHLFLTLRDRGVRLTNAIHPTATIAADSRLGLGVVVCAGAIVGTGSTIGDGVILNTSCSVDHHSWVDVFTHICPGARLGGGVRVGEGVLVGIGAAVTPGRSIGEWSVVGAGSVVVKDVPSYCVAAGVPARVIRRTRPALLDLDESLGR